MKFSALIAVATSCCL